MEYTNISFFDQINSTTKINASIAATTSLPARDILVSDYTLSLFTFVVDIWTNLLLCSLGIITNIINIVVFAKLGFKDSVNISLTTIAFWDLIRVLCGAVHRLYGPVSLASPALGKTWQSLTITNLQYVNIISGNVSYVIGAYVAIERCLCVSFPFKVKTLITPKTTFTFCILLSVLIYGSFFLLFFMFESKWIYSKEMQATIAIYQYTEFSQIHGQRFFEANRFMGTIYPLLSLTTMVVSTSIIAFHLKKSSHFRKDVASKTRRHETSKQDEMTTKDWKAIKMLLVVIGVYIINLAPRVTYYMAMLCVPEFYVMKFYNNIFWVATYTYFVFDYINSSVHLFVFYSMSSKFKSTFLSTFQPKCVTKRNTTSQSPIVKEASRHRVPDSNSSF
ncbi:uncharacterized protein LOC131939997 [Physella acuta]|uniref:uncharacterized protein LOC131939997 n=1 Tax=Physella acuta TaxID=109671 RepID=UPI0027DE5BE5|nr:uncharacterized protein LOC131939997 [Physella acuta]